ncbi:MAG: translation elongation factor Ts [Phycisphaerales bacterium]|nr:MAG: translation elongation factor Ts [Phycisphaerales bacterium]
MVEISAKDVMALRNETGLPMMDCKSALIENGGDVEVAKEWLRKKLKGKMDTRTDRAAGEGRVEVAVSDDGSSGAIIELRAETDFTARNESFVNAAKTVAVAALAGAAGEVVSNDEIAKHVDALRISTSENISFARGRKIAGAAGDTFGTYVHHDGKLGVLLHCAGAVSDDVLRDVCMHVAANPVRPQGVTPDDIPADVIEKERNFAIEQAMESGKNREIAEKIVEGKMRKFYEDVALLEQPFVKEPDKKIKDLLPKGSTIKAFLRWQVGGA